VRLHHQPTAVKDWHRELRPVELDREPCGPLGMQQRVQDAGPVDDPAAARAQPPRETGFGQNEARVVQLDLADAGSQPLSCRQWVLEASQHIDRIEAHAQYVRSGRLDQAQDLKGTDLLVRLEVEMTLQIAQERRQLAEKLTGGTQLLRP